MINIKIDSRKVVAGDTFVAIRGNIVDGHDFIDKAIENGATKIIADHFVDTVVPLEIVEDTNTYLIDYLESNYSKLFDDIKFVGVTGTNGKTTTCFMTYQLLRKLGFNVAYIGTIGFYYNDNFEETANTTPDILSFYNNLLTIKENNIKIVLLEASSIGLVEKRMAGIKFDTAVFTNLTHDHLDYHLNMNNYMLAKKILFDNLKPNGYRILNSDDSNYTNYVGDNTITYGFNNSDIKCIKYDNSYKNFDISFKDSVYHINSPMFGDYNCYNTMAIMGILVSLGIDLNNMKYFSELNLPSGRINEFKYKDNIIIVDYAHTPDGIYKVLTSARHLVSGKVYVIFGATGNRDADKRPEMASIVEDNSDYFIITNDDPHYEDEYNIVEDIKKGIKSNNYEVILDRKEAIKKGFELLNTNDILLILGKGHEENIVIKDKKIPHSDIKFVQSLIEK